MPQRCTCGAELPLNALFCHQCGRPQRDVSVPIDEPETLPSEEQELALTAPPPASVGFGNPDVIRAAYPAAAIAAILGSIPFVSMLCFLWYPAAGFASVYLYRIRTGIFLAPSAGARMGAITGLLVFAVSLLIATVAFLFAGDADFSEALRQGLEQSGQPEELQRRVLELFNNPATIAAMFLLVLGLQLFITVGFAILGGALGAKILEKED